MFFFLTFLDKQKYFIVINCKGLALDWMLEKYQMCPFNNESTIFMQ